MPEFCQLLEIKLLSPTYLQVPLVTLKPSNKRKSHQQYSVSPLPPLSQLPKMVVSQLITILHKKLSCKANYLPCSVFSRMPGPTKQRRRTFTAVYMCNNSVVHWDGKGGLTLLVTMVIKTNSDFTPYPLSKYVYAGTNKYNVYLNAIQ